MATTASVYNTSRTTRQILRRHRKDQPSLILHLHNNHFRFERQNGMFVFDSPVKAFLGYIRDQKVPADLIDVLTEAGVQFFEGCLLVDVHDHRSHGIASESVLGPRELSSLSARSGRDGIAHEGGLASSLFYLQEGGRYGARRLLGATGSSDPRTGGLGGVEVYRIVLHPTSETLWADIKMLDDMAGGMWSDQEALEVEAKILALTAPPLCLTPDPQVTRIANLMLSSTALPSAYSPSHDSPYRSAKKRGANSIEMEKEEANKQRRDKIMRLMQNGHKSVLPPSQSALARPGPGAMAETGASAAAATWVPTFNRMTFIERWRIGRNAALNGGLPAGGAPPAGAAAPANGAAAPAKGGKEAAKASDKDESTDAANTSTTKKAPSKKKKKAQREKEEAEAAAAAEAAKKKAEEEAAAAAAAAAKKPKKKLTKKEREEKERKEKEEKERAEKEEKERKEKEAAAANGKPVKKSKKKQKEEAAAETANKSPAKKAGDAPGSPEKDKKASPKKTAAKKPVATTAAPAASASTPASTGKKKTPAKSDKKASSTITAAGPATNGNADLNGVGVQGTPILNSATPSVQSTPTPAHRSIPSQPQQQQIQPIAPLSQQQMQQAAIAGMLPTMGQLPFGAGNAANGQFGMPMINGFSANGNNAQATAAALAAMQGMGLGAGQFGGFQNAAQMQQMMGMMGNNGMVGFNGMPFGGQQGQQGQQQGAQQGQAGDMPVGVGLGGLANWGTGK